MTCCQERERERDIVHRMNGVIAEKDWREKLSVQSSCLFLVGKREGPGKGFPRRKEGKTQRDENSTQEPRMGRKTSSVSGKALVSGEGLIRRPLSELLPQWGSSRSLAE